MADELLDVIDENDVVIGQQMKSVVHAQGLRHRVSAILVIRDGKYLIPTASEIKVEAGGLFHSCAGHIKSGESYSQSLIREMQEELQLEAREDELEYMGSYWLEQDYPTRKEKERFEVFRIKYRPEMGEVVLNEEQVNIQWFSEDELRTIYTNTPERLSRPLKLTCEKLLHF